MTQAVKTLFLKNFPKIEKLQKQDEETPYDDLLNWFFDEEGVVLTSDLSDKEYQKALMNIEPSPKLVNKYMPNLPEEERFFMMEVVLWGLAAHQKLSKHEFSEGTQFQDLYGNYINNL